MERHHKRLLSAQSTDCIKQTLSSKTIKVDSKYNNKYTKTRKSEIEKDNKKIFGTIADINTKGTKLNAKRLASSIYKPPMVNFMPKKISSNKAVTKENEVS